MQRRNLFHQLSLPMGIILLVVSIVILKDSFEFLKNSERATGVVIRFNKISDDGGISYTPVFLIKTKENRDFIYVHTSSTAPPSWHIGETATFVYDPNDSSSARLFTYFGVFSWSIVTMGLAVFFITTGGGYYLIRQHLNRKYALTI